jgi:hypothetical protein
MKLKPIARETICLQNEHIIVEMIIEEMRKLKTGRMK